MGNDTRPVYTIMWIITCYRKFHNQLKTIYLEQKRSRIIGDLLEILMQIGNNLFIKEFTGTKRSKCKWPTRKYFILVLILLLWNEDTLIIVLKDNIYNVKIHYHTCPGTHCFLKLK